MRKVFVVAVAVICLTLLTNLISCRKTPEYDKTMLLGDMGLDADHIVWLPGKSLLDESEIPEELINNPMLENEMPVWLAKINGKIFAYGEGKIMLDAEWGSIFHGFSFMSNHVHRFYCFDTKTGELKRAKGEHDDDFITEEEAEQLFEIVKKSYESTT